MQIAVNAFLPLNFQFVFMDPPEQINMKMEIVIQPESFLMFEEIATNTKINFEVATDDFQRFEIISFKILSYLF